MYRAVTKLRIAVFGILLVAVALSVQLVSAEQIPPFGGNVYIQTSGPNTILGTGDYYTNVNGEPNAAQRLHRVEIEVPCLWPAALPVTFTVFDPESFGGLLPGDQETPEDVANGIPATRDELRPLNSTDPADFDNTYFTVRAPGGAVVGPREFLPNTTTHLRWVELVTFTTSEPGYGCGTYIIETSTSNDDDNSWALRAANIAGCTVSVGGGGTCSPVNDTTSAVMATSTLNDDPDGISGTGDEIYTGFTRISFQHNTASCQTLYFYLDASLIGQTIFLNNFDFDDPDGGNPAVSITYTPPSGVSFAGTESGNSSWNGAPSNPTDNPNPPRVGDPVIVTADQVGWWNAVVCMNIDNQYIFEGLENRPVYFEQPDVPEMTVSKTDGLTEVSASGQQVTYTITYQNIGLGAAIDTVITDTMPVGATFVSCSNSCTTPGGVPTWNVGMVPGGATGNVTVTVNLPPAPDGSTHVNNVTLSYTDIFDNTYPDETAQDIDVVRDGPTITPTSTVPTETPGPGTPTVVAQITPPPGSPPVITKSVNPPFAQPGQAVTWTIVVSNPTSNPITNVRVVDTLPAQFEIQSVNVPTGAASVSGQVVTFTLGSLAPGASVQITVNSVIRSSAQVPYVLENNACLTADQQPSAICARATVTSAGSLPPTGESPWSMWRAPLLLGGGLLLVMALAFIRRLINA
jgi:uncharacterized repeat protein (TIGR01451 family)